MDSEESFEEEDLVAEQEAQQDTVERFLAETDKSALLERSP